MATLIRDKYEAHKAEVNARFDQLRANEEELNRIFAEIYDMEGEVPIEVEDKYVSVARIFDTAEEVPESFKGNRYVRTKRDEVVSLISYAVGCMFGRYSLDVEGLVLADAGDTVEDYLAKMPDPAHVTFMPDADNVLPITDDEYFKDDIVARLVDFIRTVYGSETLNDNLAFIADALSPAAKAAPLEVIRAYFLKEFYADHCSTYKKAPSTGCSTPARRTASRRSSTCTATASTSWPASAPTTSTRSRNACAGASPTPRRSSSTASRAARPRSTRSSSSCATRKLSSSRMRRRSTASPTK